MVEWKSWHAWDGGAGEGDPDQAQQAWRQWRSQGASRRLQLLPTCCSRLSLPPPPELIFARH